MSHYEGTAHLQQSSCHSLIRTVPGPIYDRIANTYSIAIITLTPLSTSIEFRRVLKLDRVKNTIVVGRASKNAGKGLLANADNTWFESPIMSRKHATISISTNPQVEVMISLDCDNR